MKFGSTICRAFALLVIGATALSAQGNPAKRLSSIVSVAVEEYSKAFDKSELEPPLLTVVPDHQMRCWLAEEPNKSRG